jgi:hypothetical protein
LVTIPVFFQAPLVRLYPWISLLLGAVWLVSGWQMLRRAHLKLWGDLALGFTWTWVAGSLYWGWFRWEPLVHLPMEAIGLPIVGILLLLKRAKVGSYFYLGSLVGTAITDLYFYWVGLIPHWRRLMVVEPAEISQVLHSALLQMQSPFAIERAGLMLGLLICIGMLPMTSPRAHWWAFSGAVLSTILVDALFFLSAVLA